MSSNQGTSPPQQENSKPERPNAVQGLEMEVAQKTDTGRSRPHNEDYVDFYVPSDRQQLAEKGAIYLVADGMGGHNAGEVASEGAAKLVIKEYYLNASQDVGTSLVRAFRMANRQIYDWAQADRTKAGMGTTLVAAVVVGRKVYVASAGDSRAYVINAQGITQITTDHSWVEEQVKAGLLTPEQARVHPQRNVVTRALGSKPSVEVDLLQGELAEGDVLLLCSDGLTGHVNDQEIAAIVQRHAPHEAARLLVEQANERGGSDNISVLIVRAHEEQATVPTAIIPPPPPPPPERGRIWPLIWAMTALAGLLFVALLGMGGYWVWQQVGKERTVPPLSSTPVITDQLLTATLTAGVPLTGTATLALSPTLPSATDTVTQTLAQPTATLVPTFTPVPFRTATPNPTQRPTTPPPTNTAAPTFPAPTLVSPQAGDGPTGKPRFTWAWTGPELSGDYYFDLRIWADDEAALAKESRRGAIALARTTEAEVDLEKVPAIQEYGSGLYYWTVVVVESACPTCAPRRIAGRWGEERPFNYAAPSPGGGGDDGGENPAPPPPS